MNLLKEEPILYVLIRTHHINNLRRISPKLEVYTVIFLRKNMNAANVLQRL